MAETSPIAPPWTWKVTLGSGSLALVSHVLGGSETGQITRVFAAITVIGITYLLYKWRQCRDPPSKRRDGDTRRRREQEMKAEAGGWGGNM